MYNYDITNKVLEKQIISKLGIMDCEGIGLVDVKTRQYILRNVLRDIEGPTIIGDGDFDERARTRLPLIVVPNELERVLDEFEFNNITKELETKEYYDIVYSVIDNTKNVRRKRFRTCYLDDRKTLILYSRSDVTDMYKKEQELIKQIEEALEQAKQASEAKTEFFSSMSHDMRTPMNGILGLAELSKDEKDITVLKENINKISSSGEYLLGLINDTLDFQKIESGKIVLIPQVIKARDALNSVINMININAKDKNIDFRVVTNDDASLEGYIKVDAMRIKQVFVNLLSNAIKFTPNGGTVELAITRLGKEGNITHDELTVTDTGVGMSEDFMQNGIFKPFSQENNGVTTSFAGTGLGLSIAKRLIELMGGTISVESELGVGTKFTILLDFENVEIEELKKEENEKDSNLLSIDNILKNCNILLAEDHPLNGEIAIRLLNKEGCNVIWTKNGQECVEAFEKSIVGHFDAIIMDIRMPIMDGLEAARTIREMDKKDAKIIPIIAMSDNAYEEDVKQSLEAGMNAHVSKPIKPRDMYKVLAEEILKNAKKIQ